MDLKKFNQDYLIPLMEKLSNENKKVFLIGDFNVDLMKIDINVDTPNFFDVITSNLLVPHIIHLTRITPTTKTLTLSWGGGGGILCTLHGGGGSGKFAVPHFLVPTHAETMKFGTIVCNQ